MKRLKFLTLVAALIIGVAVAVPTQAAAAEGDAEAGKKVFRKCKSCHTVKAGKHRIGPSLFGVLGRQAGTAEGFEKKYKDMKAAGEKGLTWNEDTLAAFLKKDGKKGPREYIGSLIGKKSANIGQMKTFKGLAKQADIDNLIAYIKANSQ